jgi:hypothetical protein
MKKIIWPGIVIGVITLILGMAVSYLFMLIPSVNADYSNPAIMRSWQDPLMMLFFLYTFIQGIIFAWAWNKSKTLFKGSSLERGGNFGLAIFVIATIPGMFITYTSMPYSFMTVISWTVGGLINSLVAGWILVRMN